MTNAGEVKACCAAAYPSDLVALLLGDSYHPGGQALTRRLAAGLDLREGQSVLGAARTAVADGILGDALLLADKPA